MEFSYETIKELARQTGRRVTDLIALAAQNDPFYTGTPGEVTLAEWFADFYHSKYGIGTRVHVRRCHYKILSLSLTLPNGKPYENTEECWNTLLLATKAARYLRLVDVAAFEDKKNAPPVIYGSSYSYDPQIRVYSDLYTSDLQLPDFPSLPSYSLDYYQAAQPYHIELWCFPPETLVQTVIGPKPISSIEVGEMVLTHQGRYRPVTHIFQRPYAGELVRVRARYSAHDVRMTPNHQVLALRGKQSNGGRTAKELVWIPASDLIKASVARHYKGDYLVFPRLVELPTALPMIEPDKGIGGRANGSGAAPVTPETLPIDTDTAWMLGFFLGDGHVGQKSILFALHANEQAIAERLMQIGSRFGIQPTLHRYGNTLRVAYNAVRLLPWFREQFGGESNGNPHTGSHSKRIPPWLITAPQEVMEAFLSGYATADGTQHSPGHQSIVTASPNIAAGVRLMLARLGHFPTTLITNDHHYLVRWGGTFQTGKRRENYLLLPIRAISTEQYEGTVYNLEVAEDNSYVTEFAVHNCEKTTMNDILLPLCERYGMTLQTGAGELSITATKDLAERIAQRGKPARIFYISDYDPAGQSMPVAVARKLEYFIRTEQLEADVRLFPVVLTAEQVQRYQLPRTPIKESERRKESFEARHGTGATELDALEALRPGELQRVLRRYIESYYDTGLERRTREARDVLEADLRQVRNSVLEQYTAQLEASRQELEGIRADFAPRMQAYSNQVQLLWQGISREMEEQIPDLDEYPLPEAQEAQEIGEGLYNSERDYLTQIDAYKQFQGK